MTATAGCCVSLRLNDLRDLVEVTVTIHLGIGCGFD
jgi:hypothetical protein